MKKHDFETYKKGRKQLGINTPIGIDDNQKAALMWYYLSWHQKIRDWPIERKKRYAKEVSKIAGIIPIHLIGRNYTEEAEINAALSQEKIKRFRFKNKLFEMYNKKGVVISRMTGTKLYALLVYLVDQLSKGLEEQIGFEYIQTAKQYIKLEDKKR